MGPPYRHALTQVAFHNRARSAAHDLDPFQDTGAEDSSTDDAQQQCNDEAYPEGLCNESSHLLEERCVLTDEKMLTARQRETEHAYISEFTIQHQPHCHRTAAHRHRIHVAYDLLTGLILKQVDGANVL